MTPQAYTPPQWANQPSMVSISVPAATSSSSVTAGTSQETPPGTIIGAGQSLQVGSQVAQTSAPSLYVFDAVLDLEHEQRLVKTQHPIQTGADISSHAYLMPARLIMYIGMSDAMAAYSGAGVTPFSGSSHSKSVNAFRTILALQAARTPLTITTRLRVYANMLVVSPSPREDYKTITSLRMRVEFEELYTASTSSTPATARPDATQSTGQGTVNPTPVPAPTQSQFQQPQQTPAPLPSSFGQAGGLATLPDSVFSPINIPGAGGYSSVPGQQGAAQ